MRQPFYCRGTQLDGRIRKVFKNKCDSSHRHALKTKTLRKLSFSQNNFAKTFAKTNFFANTYAKTKFFAKSFAKTKTFRENENICEKKFREILRKLAHLRLIFAFRENEKTVLVSTLGDLRGVDDTGKHILKK
jgi:hypothetical protein